MPAASWPRCWSTVSPSYSAAATSLRPTMPRMPHMENLRDWRLGRCAAAHRSERRASNAGASEPSRRICAAMRSGSCARARSASIDHVRQQARVAPPGIARQRRQPEHQHYQHHQHHAAGDAEDTAKQTISAGQAGAGNQFAQHPGGDRANQQDTDEDQRIGQEDARRRRFDGSTECVRELRCQQCRSRQCQRPHHQRHHFDHQTAKQADHDRSRDCQHDQPVGRAHG